MAAAQRQRGGRGKPGMATKAELEDWLNLVEPDGAFLTPGDLVAAFPAGFDRMPPEHRTELRSRVVDLDGGDTDRAALRRWLLATVLDWDDLLVEGQQIPATTAVQVAEHGVRLHPAQVLLDVEDANAVRLGVFVWPLGTRLDRRPEQQVTGDAWSASPVQRAETWCRESGVALAIVTDDDQWVLVWAPRGAPAASGRWTVSDLADERILQQGLVSLLGAQRFFAVEDDETIEALFRRAADAEAELTKGLGRSVRRSVELLVAAISRDDVASDGEMLDGVETVEVYEATVTVLMRLVFLLFAEERQLLPAEDPLWASSYSVLTLRDDLRRAVNRDGEDALERRSTAWHRLLATFRAVHQGAHHDELNLPGYGGRLFDPDRFPFLEGRRTSDHFMWDNADLGPAPEADTGPGRPVAVDDRTVLAVLDALLTIQVKVGRSTVAQRVSYKALDVEQIGHCYEGLLDHSSIRIGELSLGLIGPDGDEPEITVAEMEEHLAQGDEALCEWLSDKERCRKKTSALAKELEKQPEGVDVARLRVACGGDEATFERVLPFWGLIRTDLRGLPIVLLPGSQYVSQVSTRRNMGAQYTTKALADEVVQYALEPLVYDPGPQNEADRDKWRLRMPQEILDLRVCDPAVGSGAILCAAGRYLADRLVESVEKNGPGVGPFADRLAEMAAASAEEQAVLARREVVDHCLYGVDKNPVAAEMAKLSLWLTTMARERPFTFLDHAIQVGDSLLGITDLDQLRWLHLDPSKRQGVRGFDSLAIDMRIKEATDLAKQLRELSVITVRDAAEKQRLHNKLREKLSDLSVVADTVVGAGLSTAGKQKGTLKGRLEPELDRIRAALDEQRTAPERRAALTALEGVSALWLRTDLPDAEVMPWDRRCLHWPLAFPEVFLEEGRPGFDAMVGNPPFLGGKRISSANGSAYREHLVDFIADGVPGNTDLVAFFLLRMCTTARSVGTLATNTISQGDTREVGLDRLTASGWTIQRAVKSEPWPNEATLEIAKLWLWSEEWKGLLALDSAAVRGVTPSLERARRVAGNPERLGANEGISFIGCALNTTAFILTEAEAQDLIAMDDSNTAVVKPFVNGQDLNDHPTHKSGRWVVDFADLSEESAALYNAPFALLEERVMPVVLEKDGYPGWADRWWQFWRPRAESAFATGELEQVIAIALTSKTVMPVFLAKSSTFSHAVGVFAYDDNGHFGLLTSALHWWWAVTYASTLETRIRYTPSDVFETFPQPEPQEGPPWDAIDDAGRELNEFRADLMVRTDLGLTKTYNRVHDPDEQDDNIVRLRELHVVLDHAVRDAYGWSDLELDHQFWETPQGVRFTVGPNAKDELLDRLLELNHERYAAEVAAGLHDDKKAGKKKAPAKAKSSKVIPNQDSML